MRTLSEDFTMSVDALESTGFTSCIQGVRSKG